MNQKIEKFISNYEKMKNMMSSSFLKYDQEAIIKKFDLKCDKNYMYIYFFRRNYRIDRLTGSVSWSDDSFISVKEADYNEVMTIYDVLCYSKEQCHPANEWINLTSLSSIQGGALEKSGGFFKSAGDYFDGKLKLLASACERLHGKKIDKGDIAYELPMFDFLSIVLRFWESDEEFPPSLQILTDKNILDYMHYETLMFAITHMFNRLKLMIIHSV